MKDKNKVFDSVHNYTKYKLVEMLINRMNGGRVKVDDLNSIENLADEVLRTLAICGLKYHQELKNNFEGDE